MTTETSVIVSGGTPNTVQISAPQDPVRMVIVSATGPQGPSGSALNTYNHIQPTPSAQWIINHNLGFKPSVELFDAGGNEFEADILHVSNNQTIVYLNAPLTGTARFV